MSAISVKRRSGITAATAALAALSAWAALCAAVQAQPAPARADPADAAASVPPLAPVSTLSTYRRHSDEALLPWKQANDTVGRIGGWRSYAREAQAAPPTAASAPASGATGGRDPHAGHAP